VSLVRFNKVTLLEEESQIMDQLNRERVLACDIGGTKTNIGIFSKGGRRPILKVFETYPSVRYPDIESIVEQFLKEHPVQLSTACLGIAGPVRQGRCHLTNLPWEVRESSVKSRFKFRAVQLINDLTATAYSVPYLARKELYALNIGKAQKGGNLALVAPGTGLGESIVVFDNGKCIPVSSEGGHVDFAPTNEKEIGLWRYLKKIYGHVSPERILTGQGLVDIHSFLIRSGAYHESRKLIKKMQENDPAAVISSEALAGRVRSCEAALDIFISILGATAGNLALTGMATGGIFLGGGIPPKILPRLKAGLFLSSLTDKGRFKVLLEKIPVHIILNDKAALLGAAVRAFEMLKGGADGRDL
jgi:glucokinase